jgi:hypothetical protein
MYSDTAPAPGPYEWSDEDVASYVDALRTLGLTDPSILLHVWQSESGLSPRPPRNGPAVGLDQWEPGTLDGLGYDVAGDPGLRAFVALSVAQQMPYVVRYYRSAAHLCTNLSGAYCWNMAPVQAERAHADPMFVICDAVAVLPGVYAGNWRAFDPGRKRGYIRGCDMAAHADAVWDARAADILARVQVAMAAPPAPSCT